MVETPEFGNEYGVMKRELNESGATRRRYTQEQRDQAVRLVFRAREESGESRGAVIRIAEQLGYGAETVRKWVKQAEIDSGDRSGVTSDEAARMGVLEQENRELRRANEILRRASAFFAAELDRPQNR